MSSWETTSERQEGQLELISLTCTITHVPVAILCHHGQGVSMEVGPGWWIEEFVRGEKIAFFTKGFITMYHRLNGFKLQKCIVSLSEGY